MLVKTGSYPEERFLTGVPTAFWIGPYQFIFWSGDRPEPAHIHVKREKMDAKFWLVPEVRLERSRGYAEHELNKIEAHVVEHRAALLEKWNDYFKG